MSDDGDGESFALLKKPYRSIGGLMRGSILTLATVVSLCVFSAPAAAQEEEGVFFAIEASASYALQHVNDEGAYHSVLVSPQATIYWGERYGQGPYVSIGDALFSSIIGGPSEATPTDATKLNASQVSVIAFVSPNLRRT